MRETPTDPHSPAPGAGPAVEAKRALLARLLREKEAAAGPALAHRAIERQAGRTPGATAVVFGDVRVTYRDLDARANRLAHKLRSLGVGPGSIAAICLERSPEMVVAVLAVLKAGGAYLPLDPGFPHGRLALMVEDSRASVLITETLLREDVPTGDARVLVVDSDWESLDEPPATPPAVDVRPDDLAYVIYTSGSTGRPKGVQIPHRALANFLRSLAGLIGVGAGDAVLAVTTLSFDIAALELLLPLTVGATVDLAAREEAADGRRLAARLSTGEVTHLQATPATWRLLLESGWAGAPGLTMLCGGEALPRALADRLLDKGKALWNLYGPTETTVWSSLARVEPGDGPVTIGRPIAKTQLYVLDARLRPTPVGVPGELYVGGEGVARGYLDRPALTAERFLPDPFGKTPGVRMYRTGDLARRRADGTLECLGRVDHQVKVRGFRVELGEIEAALSGHPGVREAAVTAFHDPSGETALAAFLSTRDGSPPDVRSLRRWLADRLPEYMVPGTVIVLDALPLTPNGKTDRNALPDPSQVRAASGDEYTPPRGPVEDALARLWGELLGRDRVGVHDDFFDLGGHSLFATQLLARVRDTFAVEPSLRDFLERPTVACLARAVQAELLAGTGLQAPPIGRAGRSGPVPASYAQQRLWFLDRLDPGSAAYNLPTALRASGALDVRALRDALTEVVRRHEVLRTTFASDGGVPTQVIGPAAEFPLPLVDLESVPEDGRDAEGLRLAAAEAVRPFDLSAGPPVRGSLVRIRENEHLILLTMHHAVSDGWSVAVLVREAAALYQSFGSGGASPLPELAVQYADYAVWQRGWLTGDVLKSQLDYWRASLDGVPALDLPTDRPRPRVPSGLGASVSTTFPMALLAKLQALGRREGATPFMTLLAGFEVLMYRYSGRDDFAVGSPIAGRTRSDLEGLIGLFVNTLALRADLSGDPGFRALLGRVRKDALGAYAHQDSPFEQVVDALRVGREGRGSGLFQVMFVLQNAPPPAPKSADLELDVLETGTTTAKFDLTFFATEAEDGLRVTAEYAAELFERATVERMLAHYGNLLDAAADDPDRPVSALPMLTDDETRRLLGVGDDGDDDEGGLGTLLAELSLEEEGP